MEQGKTLCRILLRLMSKTAMLRLHMTNAVVYFTYTDCCNKPRSRVRRYAFLAGLVLENELVRAV